MNQYMRFEIPEYQVDRISKHGIIMYFEINNHVYQMRFLNNHVYRELVMYIKLWESAFNSVATVNLEFGGLG